jgi:RNA recognition motif-containing protein
MASEDARKLFVAGLPDSVTEEVLRGLFETESGAQVAELTLPRDRMSGRPRGFAFVRLGSQEDADRARHVLDGRIVDGKAISVRPFQAEPPGARGERPERGERPDRGGGFERGGFDRGGADRGGGDRGGFDRGGDRGGFAPRGGRDNGGPAPDRTLYVGNLPYDTTPEEVEEFLKSHGAEPVVRVHLPVDQDGRKRGFGFVTLGSADVARNALDQLKGADLRGRRLIINLALPKGAAPAGRDAPGGGGDARPPRGDGNDRPPRSFGGPPPPRSFGGPPPPRSFGGPPPTPFQPMMAKNEGRRAKQRGAPLNEEGARRRRDRDEDRWRDQDDDE